MLTSRGRLAAILTITFLLAVLVDTGLRLAYSGEPLPGTSVGRAEIGGLSKGEARIRLRAEAARPLFFGRTPVSAQAAGVVLDVESTLERAEDAGRGGPLGLGSGLRGLVGDREVEPIVGQDERRQERIVAALAREVDKAPNNGGFRIDPETLDAQVRRPRSGRRLDRELLLSRIRGAAASGRRRLEVPIDTQPAVPRERVERVARKAERYLPRPLRVEAAGRSTELPRSLLAGAMTMTDGSEPKLSLPRDRLGEVMAHIASELDRPARAPEFSRAGESVTLAEKGDVRWRPREVEVGVEPGRAGHRVDPKRSPLAIGDAVRAGRHRVRLRTVRDPNSITAEQARRVDSVIGTFTTPYVPGQPRVQNIQRIARTVDGTVVAPGATFSLNEAAGERTSDKGYVEAPFISDGNQLVPTVGGGVSQFSTTLYNAAFFAGLPLNASRPHSLYIDRYPPGRESTLNFGSIDLRWTNDTGAPVVMQTSATDTGVTVRLLGDNGGRRVQARTGAREPTEGGAFQITVTRVIRYPDGRSVEQPRTTRYEIPAQ